MSSENGVEQLIEVLNQNLEEIKDPKTDLTKAIEILENSAKVFKELVEKLEVEVESNEKLHGSYKD